MPNFIDLTDEIECWTISDFNRLYEKTIQRNPNIKQVMIYLASLELTRYLVEEKNFSMEECISNCEGETAVFFAKGEKLKYLLSKGANVNKLNYYQENALFNVKSIEDAQLLLDFGVNARQVNRFGCNVLWYLDRDMIDMLLTQKTLDFALRDDKGNNVLISTEVENFDFYIANGADPYNINNKGENILLCLAKKIHEEDVSSHIIKLMTYGVSPLIKDKEGLAAIDLFTPFLKEEFKNISEMLEGKIKLQNEFNQYNLNNKKRRL